MNKSIRSKLFKWNISLVVIVLLSMFVSVQLFSEQIYKQKTIQLLEQEITLLNRALMANDVEESIVAMETSAFRLGATLLLYSERDELLFISSQTEHTLGQGMGRGRGNIAMANSNISSALQIKDGKLTESVTTSGKELLFYKSSLNNGRQLLIQLPKEKIDDALWVFQELLLYVSIIALLVAVVGSMILSKQFSQPIVSLKEIAENITMLDFGKRYRGNRQDEIGELGESLNVLSIELENTIKKLTLELDKEKTMDVLRTQFVAQASHELQTPLTVISNYVEAIEDGMLDKEELPEHIRVIQDEIESMSQLIKGMLDLNQLRSGKFSVAFEPFDMSELILTEVEVSRMQDKSMEIVFDQGMRNEVLMIHGDAVRLKQAVRNLISNGIKHSTGELRIAINVDDETIEFSVENSGKAIRKEALETLWEVFYKEEGNHKKGTGLGLAITKAIIEQHGGTYGIENTDIGVRSYFRLYR